MVAAGAGPPETYPGPTYSATAGSAVKGWGTRSDVQVTVVPVLAASMGSRVGAQNSLTPADLLPSRRRQPGMIRRWRYV